MGLFKSHSKMEEPSNPRLYCNTPPSFTPRNHSPEFLKSFFCSSILRTFYSHFLLFLLPFLLKEQEIVKGNNVKGKRRWIQRLRQKEGRVGDMERGMKEEKEER